MTHALHQLSGIVFCSCRPRPKFAICVRREGGDNWPLKIAGWSSLVARQAHNLKAAGSNPAPATNF